jgi:hypothetical protein
MSETEGLSAAQLRARKRQEKIKASASTRINKVVGTARGEEGADYMKSQLQAAAAPSELTLV